MGSRGVAFLSAGALILGALSAAPQLPATAAAPAAAPVAPDARLAFTDGSQQVQAVQLEPAEIGPYVAWQSSGGSSAWESQGRVSSQVGGPAGYSDQYAFVSTRPEVDDEGGDEGGGAEDPDGEVWYRIPVGDDGTVRRIQVTDDDAQQAHPSVWVVNQGCEEESSGPARVDIAYASRQNGNWDIYVAHLVQDPTAPQSACDQLVVDSVEQVTDDPGDDQWPAWAYDNNTGVRSIVYSSTRTDPLGDLYQQTYAAPSTDFTPELIQLTEGPAADAFPAPRVSVDRVNSQVCPGDVALYGNDPEPKWVAFTRADADHPRGQLMVLDLSSPGSGVQDLGVADSSEPAWSPDGGSLAYRSTELDPDGDVVVGRFIRACPPDLGVDVQAPTEPVTGLNGLDVVVTVHNYSDRRQAGTLTVTFPAILSAPDDCTQSTRTCTIAVPEVDPGGDYQVTWTIEGEDAPTAVAVGSGSIDATIALPGDDPQPDGEPGNDKDSAPVQVVARQVRLTMDPVVDDSQIILPTEGSTQSVNLNVNAASSDLGVGTPARITVTSDNDIATMGEGSTRSTRYTRDVTLGSDPYTEPIQIVVTRPDDEYVPVTLHVQLEALDPTENVNPVDSADVELDVYNTDSDALSGEPVPVVAPVAYQGTVPATRQASTSAIAAALSMGEPAAPALAVPAAPALAVPALLVPADVPEATKAPVADTLSIEARVGVADQFGQAEDTPTWIRMNNGDGYDVYMTFTARTPGPDIDDVLSTDGSDRRDLEAVPEVVAAHPAYSPDGRFIAYHRQVCDEGYAQVCYRYGSEIVVANADGSNPTPIYPTDDDSPAYRPSGTIDVNPAWSPDGTRIAFTRGFWSPEESTTAIWVASGLDISARDVPPADLVADAVDQVSTPTIRSEGDVVDEFDDEAAWSPDGATIAFTRARQLTQSGSAVLSLTLGAHDSDIWLVAVGSGDERPLLDQEVLDPGVTCDADESDTSVCAGGDDRGPDWAPDGTRVVYEHSGWLYLADPRSHADLGPVTGPRVLSSDDDLPVYPDDRTGPATSDDEADRGFPTLVSAQDPSWSPDGRRIAFAGQPRGQSDQRGIYTITMPQEPADRVVTTIAQEPQPETQPDWQPSADLAITLVFVPTSVALGASPVLRATVTDEGPSRAFRPVVTFTLPVGLTFGTLPAGCTAGPPLTCTLADLDAGASVTLDIPLTNVQGVVVASATVASTSLDSDPADNTATANLAVTRPGTPSTDLAVTMAIDPDPGYVGGESTLTVTVLNQGAQSASAFLAVSVPEGAGAPTGEACLTETGCDLGVVGPGVSVIKTFDLAPVEETDGEGTATVTLPQVATNPTDSVPANNVTTIPVVILQPVVALSPMVAAPGYVTMAMGTDFPPGATVEVAWDQGLTVYRGPYTVTKDGTLFFPVVIARRDQLGPRVLSVRHVSGELFGEVTTTFLVAPRSQNPPDFEGQELGVIDEVDAALKALLKDEALGGADVEVVFDAPTKDWAARRNAPTVNAYLYDIREDTRKRTRGMINEYNSQGLVVGRHLPPRFYNLSYLITAWTQRPEDEHRLLAQMLITFSNYDAMPRERLNGHIGALRLPVEMKVSQPPPEDRSFADVWTALGGELKPSIDVVLSVPLAPARTFPAGPPVFEGPVITLSDVDSDGIDEHRRRMSVAGEGRVPPPAPIGGAAGSTGSAGARDARGRAAGRSGPDGGGSAAEGSAGPGGGGSAAGGAAAGGDLEARREAARAEAARRAAQRSEEGGSDGAVDPGADAAGAATGKGRARAGAPGTGGSPGSGGAAGPGDAADPAAARGVAPDLAGAASERPPGGGGMRRTRRGAPSSAIAGDSVWSPWSEQPEGTDEAGAPVAVTDAGAATVDREPAAKKPPAKKASTRTKRKPAEPA